ncbi:ATP-dependent (S)-NAD(P)H-hydrate dehydratase-like [Dendronephthya gigantea]|uniref:ATP-dependent (S)-NAD(P)H-hydrate dehydratase-like n=1 Tax=Dendronephthya gigantea TaxID=151771 RepID=UPI00106B6313|nr:ATP-dependent (S)-NAD(P)H-hydrate dehydratase-like [Dendronephthya gigantea]
MFCGRRLTALCLKNQRHICYRVSSNSKLLTNMETVNVFEAIKQAIPPLVESKYKGQAGRIGVIGGSKEYTGAPYFAAISALKVGCDLSHVFCTSEASQVIKSYSPELIVHPLLDEVDALDEFVNWLPRLHTLVVGPGLGRNSRILSVAKNIVMKARDEGKQLVIDADGLWLITTEPDIISGYTSSVLTPNAMEFIRLYKKMIGVELQVSNITPDHVKQLAMALGGVTINAKGRHDIISDGEKVLTCELEGSLRRCGGQGDLLSGSLGTFLYWTYKHGLEQNQTEGHLLKATLSAAFAACCLTRRCSYLAFEKKNRHMTTSDMIEEIPEAFKQLFS